jgi:hypothetical protein
MVLAPISQALGLRVVYDNDRPKLTSSVRSDAPDFHVGREVRASASHVRSTPKSQRFDDSCLLS